MKWYQDNYVRYGIFVMIVGLWLGYYNAQYYIFFFMYLALTNLYLQKENYYKLKLN